MPPSDQEWSSTEYRATAGPHAPSAGESRGALYLLGCDLQDVYSVVSIAQGHAPGDRNGPLPPRAALRPLRRPDAVPEVYELPALLEAEMQRAGERGSRQPG